MGTFGTIKQPVNTFSILRQIRQGADSPRRIRAVPPRTLKPLLSWGTEGQSIAPRKNLRQTSDQTAKDLATRAEIPKNIGRDRQAISCRNYCKQIAVHFRTHSKNVVDIEKEKDPQEQSVPLKRLSGSDTAENPAEANIQGVEIHLVKQKNNGQKPTVPLSVGGER